MSKFLQFLRSFGLLIARLGVGGIMITHGLTRWRGQGQGIQKQIDYLTQFGTPYPEVAAWGATIFELVGGLFLIVGALTPIVGLGLLIEQALIIAYTSWYKQLEPAQPRRQLQRRLRVQRRARPAGAAVPGHGWRRGRDRPAVPAEEDRTRRGDRDDTRLCQRLSLPSTAPDRAGSTGTDAEPDSQVSHRNPTELCRTSVPR